MSTSASGSTIMWFLAPPSAWTRLPCARAGLVDVARDGRRADEAHGRDVGVLEDPIDRHLVALDHVEDTRRDARLGQQLGHVERGGGVLLRRLEDEGVAAGECVAEHPHRHHGREVERRDAGHDAERLADLVDVDAGRDLLAEAALEQVGHAAGELQVLQAAGDLAEGVRRDLAVLRGQVGGELLAVGVDEVPDAEHDLGATRERRRAPRGERLASGADGRIHLVHRREVDRARLAARRRVEDRARPTRGAGDQPATDPMTDALPRGGRCRVRPLDHLRHQCSP